MKRINFYDLDSSEIEAVDSEKIFGGNAVVVENKLQADAFVESGIGSSIQSSGTNISTGLLGVDSVNSSLLTTGPVLKFAVAESPTGNAKAVASVSGSPISAVSASSFATVGH
jgi:hypothetical protein